MTASPEHGLHVVVEEGVLLPTADVPVQRLELLEAEGGVGPGVLLELLPLGVELLLRHPALVGDLLHEDLLHLDLLLLGVDVSRVSFVPGLVCPHLCLPGWLADAVSTVSCAVSQTVGRPR